MPVSARPRKLDTTIRSEEHTSELQSLRHLVCRLLLEKKKQHLQRALLLDPENLSCLLSPVHSPSVLEQTARWGSLGRGKASICLPPFFFFFFNDTATTEIYTLSLHDALPI